MASPTPDLGFQNYFSTTLSSGINSTDTSIALDNVPNADEGFLVIDPDSSANREIIFYSSKTGSTVECTSAADGRGQDDTSASAHSSGVTVIMAPVAGFFEALQSFEATDADKGVLGSIRTYTANNTWTKPAGLKFVVVEVIGGGGGGGAAGSTGTTPQYAIADGGGGGGGSRKKIAVGSLSSTETVTVGAGGTAGSSGGNGGTGGTTSFGSHLQATGGGGGAGMTASSGSTTRWGAYAGGGVGSGGDINLYGDVGGPGLGARTELRCNGGWGGGSPFGYGATSAGGRVITSGQAAGTAGCVYGGGGGGGCSVDGGAGAGGGAGAAGTVVVREYF